MADVTVKNVTVKNIESVKEILNAPKIINYNPFEAFLYKTHGLRSFQPTLLWVVQFGKFKDIIFTDNITVPSETVQLTQAENYWGNIPFPVGDVRTTSNQFSIGVYVDIYSTIERYILPIILRFSRDGNKNEDLKQNINLYGYRMGTGTTSNDAAFNPPVKPIPETDLNALSKYEQVEPSTSISSGNFKNFERECYIHYQFENCIPITVDEYNYDHKNAAWANVRNVTFAYEDYKIEILNVENTTIDNINPIDPNQLNFTSEVDAKKGFFRNAGRQSGNEDFFFANNTPIFGKIEPANYNNDFDKEVYRYSPEDLQQARIQARAKRKQALITRFDEELGILRKVNSSVANDEFYWKPNVDLRAAAPFSTNDDSQKSFLYDKMNNGDGTVVESFGVNVNDKVKHRLIKNKKTVKDTPIPSDNRDSLIKTILKTAIKKFLIPDTPLYNSGTGMSWSPGFMKTVSKGIRKIQSAFYTEPKQRNVSIDDVPLINTHAKGNNIQIDSDDAPTINTHTDGKDVQIDPNDVPRVNTHTNGNKIKIDQYDHTTPVTHKADHVLPTASNDYTTIDSHGKPNNIKIDPQDYTSQGNHGTPNDVVIDSQDYTSQRNHGTPNDITIDFNDYVDSANVSFKENKIDENDTPATNEIETNERFIDQNDTVDSQSLNINQKSIDNNDFVSSQEVEISEKQTAENDTVTDFSELNVNTKTVLEDDYPEGRNIEYSDIDLTEDKMNSQLIESFDLQKIPDDSKMEFDKSNKVSVKIADNIIKHNISQVDLVRTNKNDMIKKHKKTKTVVFDDKDKLITHNKPENLITLNRNDTVDVQSIISDNKTIENSFIDFARMLVNIKKSEQDTIQMNKTQIKEIVDHNEKIPDHKNRVNLVGDPEKEIDTINPTRRNKGNLVDVHKDDHTEIVK